jgi:hypothetical protein
MGTKIKVKFSSITLHTVTGAKRLIGGNIESVYDPTWGNILSIDGITEGGNNVGIVRTGLAFTEFNVDFPILNANNIVVTTNATGGATITFTGTGSNLGQAINSGSLPTSIRDREGRIYGVTSTGARYIGRQGGVPMSSGELNTLSLDKGVATFTGGGFYAFDAYNAQYENDILWKSKYEKIDTYGVGNKASAPGKPDVINVSVRFNNDSFRMDSVKFITSKGMNYASRHIGNGVFEVPLVGAPGADAQELYALHPKTGGKYWSLGKLLVPSYEIQKRKLVLVPVNGVVFNKNDLADSINRIYRPVCVEWEVSEDANFVDLSWDHIADGKLQVDESGFWSTLTTEMKALKRSYAQKRMVDKNSIYLFVLAEANNPMVAGDMPRSKQFGYLFLNTNTRSESGKTIAHEVGHGVFHLKHTFDSRYSFSRTDLPNNLLNYGKGEDLSKYQWDMLHDLGLAIGLFDKDEDVQNRKVSVSAQFVNPTTQGISFLSENGSIITLPWSGLDVNFNYGAIAGDASKITSNDYNFDLSVGTVNSFTIERNGTFSKYKYDYTSKTYKLDGNGASYVNTFDTTLVNGFVYPMPCGTDYILYKFPKGRLSHKPVYENGEPVDFLKLAEFFLPFSTAYQPLSNNGQLLKQVVTSTITEDCLWCRNANTVATTKDFCEQPSLLYLDKRAQLAVVFPEYHKAFTRNRVINTTIEDVGDATVLSYQYGSSWGRMMDSLSKLTPSPTLLTVHKIFLEQFRIFIEQKKQESETFWFRLSDTTSHAVILNHVQDESVLKMKEAPLEQRLLAIRTLILTTNCYEPQEDAILKIMASFELSDHKTVLDSFESIKIKTFFDKFHDVGGKDNFTKVIFALSNFFDAKKYNDRAVKLAAGDSIRGIKPRFVGIDVDIIANKRTYNCEINASTNEIHFKDLEYVGSPIYYAGMAAPVSVPTTFLTAKYDELIAVKFWSDFDATLEGKGRKYKAGNVTFLPAIVVAAMMHNGEKVLWEKKAWLTLDGIALVTGVGQARMALRAGSWLNELRLLASTADVTSSAFNLAVSVTADKYISQETKDDVAITCMFFQAPEMIWSIGEVVQHFWKTRNSARRIQNDPTLLESSRQSIKGLVRRLDDVLDAPVVTEDFAEFHHRIAGLTDAEAISSQTGLRAIQTAQGSSATSPFYLAIHSDGKSFKVFKDGQWQGISHHSVAKWIVDNVPSGKPIVLLSCNNPQSSQKLANILGRIDPNNPRQLISWEGRVSLFENGYIDGEGKCFLYERSRTTELFDNNIPKGTNLSQTANTKGIVFNTDWEKWIKNHYTVGDEIKVNKIKSSTLLLGEGDFSFALSIGNKITNEDAALITATEYRQLNQLNTVYSNAAANIAAITQKNMRILGGIDVNTLSTQFVGEKFKTVMFQFPFMTRANGSGDIRGTQLLLQNLFAQADPLMDTGGYIYITQTSFWGKKLDLGNLCAGSNFELIKIKQFKAENFQGYAHRQTSVNISSNAAMDGDSYTFIFKKK